MARREVRVVVLYEDRAHDSFLRRLVKKLQLEPVRFEKCGDSTGVLRSLGREVDALRAEKHQRNLGLLACIDADEKGLTGRVAELMRRIAEDTKDGARADAERIALIVPMLEIENWYVHLCIPASRPIDEARDYKPSPEWRELAKDLGAASRRATDAWHPPLEREPSSLCRARAELSRLV